MGDPLNGNQRTTATASSSPTFRRIMANLQSTTTGEATAATATVQRSLPDDLATKSGMTSESKGNGKGDVTTEKSDSNQKATEPDDSNAARREDATAKQGKTSTNGNDDDIDADLLRSQVLRYAFRDFDFDWTVHQKAGWTYNPTRQTYLVPPSIRKERLELPNAGAVLDYLDEARLPDVTSTLQPPGFGRQQRLVGSEYEERLILREQLLRFILRTNTGNKKKGTEETAEKEGDESDDRKGNKRKATEDATGTGLVGHSDSRAAADVDKGGTLYLNKRSKRGKQAIVTGVDVVNMEGLNYPTLAECATFLQGLGTTSPTASVVSDKTLDQWQFLLSTNHSLLVYGAGSKYNLLESFGKSHLSREGYVLALHGFDPNVSITGILDLLVTLFLDNVEPPSRGKASDNYTQIQERAVRIATACCTKCHEETLFPIFLVIHNLEGMGLRNHAAQDALAALVAHSRPLNHRSPVAAIRIVASIDHVGLCASTLWTTTTTERFNWSWKAVHTHATYATELEGGILADEEEAWIKKQQKAARKHKQATSSVNDQDSASALRIIPVLAALSPRHAEVVQVLARLQLERVKKNAADAAYHWVPFTEFREACKQKCIVSKDQVLHSYIQELQDHTILEMTARQGRQSGSKTRGGGCSSEQVVRIPHAMPILEQILAFTRSEK